MVSVITLIFLLIFGTANAATYYVATTGNNSNDGSEATPWLTIQKATTTMVAGDTTYVRGGTYDTTGEIRFGVTGTSSAPIKLLNYPGELPIINYTTQTTFDHILIQNNTSFTQAMGWITISGFEIRNGYEGIKFYNLHDSTISHNWIHDQYNQGILGSGSTRIRVERNIINHIGPFSATPTSNKEHGIYIQGSHATILNNVIYDNLGYGLQQNGGGTDSIYNPARHAGVEFSGANNWIVANNTFAYNRNRAGAVVWGALCDDSRYENNIFYENSVTLGTGEAQGINCTSCTSSTGLIIKNNHFYASGSGGQVGPHASLVGTISDNVTNVSAPAFVDGGSNVLPAVPDFRLTALSPVNIPLSTEIPTNGVVGAFQPPATPTGTITTNKIVLNFPMFTATPIQNISTAGISVSCVGSNCPSAPYVGSASRASGTDTQVELTINGISGNACVSTNQNWSVTYASSTGAWTGNDSIGSYPGLHQKILSFTSLAVTNQCTGSGPPGGSASHIHYPMDNGAGTVVTDTSGNSLHGTLVNGAGWAAGKTGTGVKITGGTTQQMTVPYGSGINPTTQSMTWVIPVFVATGTTQATNYIFGTEIGTNQRAYIGSVSGTWRVARQSTTITSAGASNLAVTEGWNHLVVVWNSATDTVTLYKNGVAGTGGATGTYTSYTFPTNFEAPIFGTNFPSTATETLYDDMQIFTTVEDPAALYAAWNTTTSVSGTFAQAAIQFQGVILDTAGSPIVIGPSVQTIEVPGGGGAVLLFQVHCQNISDCSGTAFKLVYAESTAPSVYQQVPDTETSAGTWMWGVATEASINNGLRSTRLTGSCTVTNGTTQTTSSQTTFFDLPQDGCVVLAYIVKVGTTAIGRTFEYRLLTESGSSFTGGYSQVAGVRVVNPMASGIGF